MRLPAERDEAEGSSKVPEVARVQWHDDGRFVHRLEPTIASLEPATSSDEAAAGVSLATAGLPNVVAPHTLRASNVDVRASQSSELVIENLDIRIVPAARTPARAGSARQSPPQASGAWETSSRYYISRV